MRFRSRYTRSLLMNVFTVKNVAYVNLSKIEQKEPFVRPPPGESGVYLLAF